MRLNLTYDETKKLEKDGCVYCLRDKTTYLVEQMDNRYIVTVFTTNIEVVKSYQHELV